MSTCPARHAISNAMHLQNQVIQGKWVNWYFQAPPFILVPLHVGLMMDASDQGSCDVPYRCSYATPGMARRVATTSAWPSPLA